MINEAIEKKYTDVQVSLETALEKINSIELLGEENSELAAIKSTLDSLNEKFKTEIEELRTSTVWDKLCIAFFGETNAGKSTIIETLRIIYEEETRRAEILSHQKEYLSLLKSHCEDYQSLISSLEEINGMLKTYSRKKPSWLLYLGIGIIGFILGIVVCGIGAFVW